MTTHTAPEGPVTEMVELQVAEGAAEAFEAAVAEAEPLFREHGATSFILRRQVEEPQRYRLLVDWPTIEAHTVDFRESEAFPAWRVLVTPHLAQAPQATHWTAVTAQG
ncbi:antibiotic biosynthesis monooxygenase [Micrococcus sp.]|uniref:antibiotic biosynthesis monooxygenase n=1 Tax=Micrococcus sp. TaxID=1271 RepID=UPI002A918CC5|nr:antibiotic biosynthesis monooxygenase [Micrococcus sp.]MDY6055000.1 antibiotic biosynthesis monooxygenase [Micrococcus sp.]